MLVTPQPVRRRTLSVKELSRVEGQGGLRVVVRDGNVKDVQFRVYEPPRLFEALLVGRSFTEPPDLTARICGICPVAYQMSACRAIEDACGVVVDPPLERLRRLLYCGEWIQSHVLHISMLHAPDFLGYPGMIEMAADHRQEVDRALGLKKVGNQIMELIGGRAIHPINIRLGGFYRVPARRDLQPLAERLRWAREAAWDMVRWVSGFEFPDFQPAYQFVSMVHASEYPILEGHLQTSRGTVVAAHDFERRFIEEQVAHSTALHCRTVDGERYLVGPLARYNLNFGRLGLVARQAAAEAGLGPKCRNPFQSIIVRSVEVVHACDEALRLIEEYREPERPFVAVEPVPATGCGITEAPRGTLYHRYRIGSGGLIADACIVPPTSQNQGQIEDDLRELVQGRPQMPSLELTRLCEQAIRNYDPCISCSTHVLDLPAKG